MDYLKLLDMTEQEQRKWLVLHHILKYKQPQPNQIRWESLADLAFRLRDEAMKNDKTKKLLHDALYEIQVKLGETDWATAWWGYAIARPIHWIAAALIAKGDE